jgi:hypothetical protein
MHELRRDASATVRFLDGEHSDVSAQRAGAVGVEFANYDTDEGGGRWVEGLVKCGISTRARMKGRGEYHIA